MNSNEKQFTVITIHVNGVCKPHLVKGTDDGPNCKDINDLLDCKSIEIVNGRLNGKNYRLYVDEEGRPSKKFANTISSQMFLDWLNYENRISLTTRLVGTAAIILDEEDISQQDKFVDDLQKIGKYLNGLPLSVLEEMFFEL